MRPEENSARQRFGGRDLPTFRAAFGARSRASCSRRVMNARSAVAVGLRCRGARYRRRDGQARVDLGEAPVFLNVLAPANDAVGKGDARLAAHELAHLEGRSALAAHEEPAAITLRRG